MSRLLVEFVVRSALIALVIGVGLRLLRIRRAAVQHAAWVGVMVAMLALPGWMAFGPKARVPVLPALPVAESAAPAIPDIEVGETVPLAQAPRANFDWSGVLLGVYVLGALVLLLRLAVGTIRARRLTSASCAVPVTVGLLRPRIISPESAKEWPAEQLAAVMAHEREHVRRRDPLFQWIALFNRALFWFHPLAWWLERRLGALAEEACDAAVIEQGHDAREYSMCLLDLARNVEREGARVNVVAMAMPGVYLPERIKRIVAGVRAPRVSRARLALAGLVCAIPAALFASGTIERLPPLLRLSSLPALVIPRPPELIAQVKQAPAAAATTPTAKLEFDAASVRAAAPFVPGGQRPRGGPGTSDPERMNFQYITMKLLLLTAYGLPANQIFGPPWIDSEHYDITAKVPPGATKEQVNVMLQNLLADRFKLVVHREAREMPLYELTVGKGGSKLKPYVEDPNAPTPERGKPNFGKDGNPIPPPGGIVLTMGGPTRRIAAARATVGGMPGLALTLGNELGRPVIDKTGLDGYYDYTLEFRPQGPAAAPPGQQPPPASDSDAPDIVTAVEEQLGLKLVAKKGPVEVVVVDSGEKAPTEN